MNITKEVLKSKLKYRSDYDFEKNYSWYEMHEDEGMSFNEIARLERTSPQNVHRAVRIFREKIEEANLNERG